MSKDMDITGLFQLLDPASFPAQLQAEGLGFSSALWSQVGAQAVIKMKVSARRSRGAGLHRRPRRQRRLDQELPRRRRARCRPRLRQRRRQGVHRPAGRVRLAHRAGAHRSQRARDRRRRHGRWAHGGRHQDGHGQSAARLLPDRAARSPSPRTCATTPTSTSSPRAAAARAGSRRSRGSTPAPPGRRTVTAWPLTMSYEGNSEALPDQPRRRPGRGAPHQQPRHRQLAGVLARRLADRLRLEPAGLAADLHHVGLGRRRQAGHLPREVQPDAALEPARRQTADRLHRTRRAGRLRRLHPRRQERQDRSRDAGEGLEPRPDLVARRPPLAYVSSRGGLYVNNPETHHEVQVWRGSASSPSWGPAPAR